MLIEVFAAWMLADFLSGVIHWWEDRLLGHPKTGWLAVVARANDTHHAFPELIGSFSLWENMKSHAPLAWALSAALWASGAPVWAWLTFFFASFANVIHRWSHVPRTRVPIPVRYLQKTGLMISAAHHATHHRVDRKIIARDESFSRYCAMTSLLNPILDSVGFFQWLESIVFIFYVPTVDWRSYNSSSSERDTTRREPGDASPPGEA